MKTRILTAAAALAIFLPILYFSENIVFPIVIGLLSAAAFFEFAHCAGIKGKKLLYATPLLAAAALVPVLTRTTPVLVVPAALAVFLYILFLSVTAGGKVSIPEQNSLFFGFFYIALSFSALVSVRDSMPNRYLLIFIAAWATDTFAYFGGYFFGKKKLCPSLSPKKTVAGAVAGVIGAVVCFNLFGLYAVLTGGSFDFLLLSLLAAGASVIAQLGDLSASAIKRHYGIKDYGNIFPGHGGVLDRFDSILPLCITAYILVL